MILCSRRDVCYVCVCVKRGEERRGEKRRKYKLDKRNEILKNMYINKENIKYKNIALQGRINDSYRVGG